MKPCLWNAGFLELEGEPPRLKNSELIAAMSAMRCYPLPEVAQESALFWRILLDSRETSLAWASELRLQEASCLVRHYFQHGFRMQPTCIFLALC